MTARRIYSPWEHIGAAYPDWVVRRRELHGPREMLCWRRRVVLLELDQGTAAARCSLAHAIGHLELRHAAGATTARFRDHEEAAADLLAARRLIPLARLVEAAQWSTDLGEMASDLWVDRDMLRCRIDHLHPAERAAVRQALATREHAC